MMRKSSWAWVAPISMVASLGMVLVASCSKPPESDNGPSAPGGPMAGPGGPRFEPVAATATATEIFHQKCQGCHGDKGQGKRGPDLTKVGDQSDAQLRTIIHDGHDKMPAFAKQMTEAQIDALVTYVRQLGAAK